MQTAARSVAAALCLCLVGCDRGAPQSASSSGTPTTPAAPVTRDTFVGNWEMHPDSASDGAYNIAVGTLVKNGIAVTESQVAKELKLVDASTVAAAAGVLTLNADGTVAASAGRTGTWTFENGVVTFTYVGDPEARRVRSEGNLLVVLPRMGGMREIKLRRK